MKKILFAIFSIIFVLSLSNMASAFNFEYTNNTDVYVDTTGTTPYVWVQLPLPADYSTHNITDFVISMGGKDTYTGANIDVWLSHTINHTSYVKIDSFATPQDPFTKTWTLPNLPLHTVNYSYFDGNPNYFYIGYGCHFTEDWSKVQVSWDDQTGQPPVPEPATMLLLGSGLIGLAGYGRKKFFKK